MMRRPPRSTLFPYPTLFRSHRGDVAAPPALALTAARHREVGVEVDGAAGPAVAPGYRPDQRACVQDAIAEGEGVDGHEIEPRVGLQAPVGGAQLCSRAQELLPGHLAAPIALGRPLQLTSGADGRKAEIVGNGHGEKNLPREAKPGSGAAEGRPSASTACATAPVRGAHRADPRARGRRRARDPRPPVLGAPRGRSRTPRGRGDPRDRGGRARPRSCGAPRRPSASPALPGRRAGPPRAGLPRPRTVYDWREPARVPAPP